MLRSCRSRPLVQYFLSAPGPLVLYVVLTGPCTWAAYHAGWHSAGAVVCGLLALLFGLVAVQEVRFCITGRWPPGR